MIDVDEKQLPPHVYEVIDFENQLSIEEREVNIIVASIWTHLI